MGRRVINGKEDMQCCPRSGGFSFHIEKKNNQRRKKL
jgi:hypothetical protein